MSLTQDPERDESAIGMNTGEQRYTTREAETLTGVPRRAIVVLSDRRIVTPCEQTSGRGVHRRYDRRNLIDLVVASALGAFGIRRVLIDAYLRALGDALETGARYLVALSDGTVAVLVDAVDIVPGPTPAAIVVDIERIVRTIDQARARTNG